MLTRDGAEPSAADVAEVERFAEYLQRRAQKPEESPLLAYAEHYGEVVYEAKDGDQ